MDPLRKATNEVSKRTPYQSHPTSRIRHVSPQTQFLIQQIVSSLNTFRQGSFDTLVTRCFTAFLDLLNPCFIISLYRRKTA